MPVLSLTLISAREILRMETPLGEARSQEPEVRTLIPSETKRRGLEGTGKYICSMRTISQYLRTVMMGEKAFLATTEF